MFPMEFDYRILSTLPLPDAERTKIVARFLKSIVGRRVTPYFKNKRGTDPLKLAQLADRLSIVRMEDENNAIRLVSLLSRTELKWTIQIHERVFDYFSFVLPGDLETRLGEGTRDERKMLALAEFLLRHDVEHMLYPERTEREAVLSDADFAVDRRTADPTFYRMLRSALADEMSGLKGQPYLALLDQAEKELPLDAATDSILGAFASGLSDAPAALVREIFPALDSELKGRILDECYRRSRNTAGSLLKRTHDLRTALELFSLLVKKDKNEALKIFQAFRDHWGLMELFKELDLSEAAIRDKAPEDLLGLLDAGLNAYLNIDAPAQPIQPATASPSDRLKSPENAGKSLKDRIEDARNDPAVPRRVVEVIDKNKLNAVGHSGSKYSEFIETLLAVPWGKMRRIRVSPKEFEEGLDRSHYGLETPKELLCDFFTNLIWRCRRLKEGDAAAWRKMGSAFLLVGPPGVGKTSLAISVAQNLGIPYHKLSLGGMRDEADIRGHGFTYEGSKPGAIVEGLIKMEVMNGMFILDEADKTEKFAIATLLEILDPEQNHLFHDKYAQTSVDIDLSNCHFFLTANSLESVPPVVVNRCEVVVLDRYSTEEKVAIAQKHLIGRVRDTYRIREEDVYFDPEEEEELLRCLIRAYTYEAGVRELERIIRTLFLRIQRKEILTDEEGAVRGPVRVTRERIRQYLEEPLPPRQIGQEDSVGEMLALGVDVERGVGSVIPIQATRIGAGAPNAGAKRGYLSIVHATGNIEKVMDESRKVAGTGIFHCAKELGIDLKRADDPVHLHFMGGSTRKDGPSAGGAIALVLASHLSGRKIRRDAAMTGEIDTKGRITAVGALALKIETAFNAGCKTVIIPRENLYGKGGIERFPLALKKELQILTHEEWSGRRAPFDYLRHIMEVVAVDDIVQAADVAFIDQGELDALETRFDVHARETARALRPGGEMRLGAGLQLGGAQASGAEKSPCTRFFVVKSADELEPGLLAPPAETAAGQTVLLVLPEAVSAVQDRLGESATRIRIEDFDFRRQKLLPVMRDILAQRSSPSASATAEIPAGAGPVSARTALIAPYFLLARDGILTEASSSGALPGEFLFFANNYTVQQVKMKRSKPVFNSVYALLALLSPEDRNACPFLGKLDGVLSMDMSFIPEKYRLDEVRAERILGRTLARWVERVRSSNH